MLRLVFGLFLFSTISYSSPEFGNPSSESYDNKKFEPGKMIMHHILDSHEWHVFDWKGKAFSIPLPIIIYHETRGLSVFMSSRFNHGYDAYKGYMMDHGNIICVNETGQLDQNETNKIWDFSITKNVFSLFFSIIILLSIFLTISKKYNERVNRAPSGLQSFLEPIIIFIRDDIAKSAIGEKDYQRYLPFLLTVFFFIFLNNLLGLVPLFPGGANLTGNIAVPMVMSAMVFIITTLSGKKYYWCSKASFANINTNRNFWGFIKTFSINDKVICQYYSRTYNYFIFFKYDIYIWRNAPCRRVRCIYFLRNVRVVYANLRVISCFFTGVCIYIVSSDVLWFGC